MRTGAWHQCGDRSQKIVIEELQNGKGVGAVLSPRDLAFEGAKGYATQYCGLGAEVAIDPQFYNPSYRNPRLSSYPTDSFRVSISNLLAIGTQQLATFAKQLEQENAELGASVLIAPAVLYEAGRADIIDLNMRLLKVAKTVGDELGIPTLSTVFLGRSVTQSDDATNAVLSAATSEACNGWYFGFEFPDPERIPSPKASVKRFCRSALALACTGLPVLHAYAGPMAILSVPFGADAVGVGHFKNLWHFHRSRWTSSQPSRRGGPEIPPPPRFFSRELWGTIVYPDEVRLLASSIQSNILHLSPFSGQVGQGLNWDRWSACKHLVSIICDEVATIAALQAPRDALAHSKNLLHSALSNLASIASSGLRLRDDADAYQANWLASLEELEQEEASNFEYLELVK